ncbi:MAG: MBG domain-containing protein, partial [Eubacteriales bacterium]|nr:MBG domain-containing protein [Eubacteriales bacterium]
MKKQWKYRLLSGILTVCLVLGQGIAPIPAYAQGVSAGGEADCPHHIHDTECGYTEGTPCAHQHTADCYISVESCVHRHTEACYPKGDVSDNDITQADQEPTACTHACSEESGCITKEPNCRHAHDGECGYTEGTPCTFDPADCEICNPAEEGDDTEPEMQEQCSCVTHCTEEQINTACPVCSKTDADLTACKGEPAEDVLPDAVREVQALIDALPDIDAITVENAESVGKLLDEIDAAKAKLTDAELELLDLTRYIAAANALGGLDRPMLLADPVPVTTWGGLMEAISRSSGTQDNPETIYVSGKITATARLTVSAGKYVKIVGVDGGDGEKCTITRDDSFTSGSSISRGANFFRVQGYLELENVVLDGNGTGTPGKYKSLIYVDGDNTNNATAVLGEGAVLRNNDDSAVTVKDAATEPQAATFIMQEGSEIYGNVSEKGAAVWLANYGFASFIMNGGTIRNNEAISSAENYSGGAAIFGTAQGKICINGGQIVNNLTTDTSSGGAIRLNVNTPANTELIMTGGEISGNTMTNENGLGGGICTNATVTITGGAIQNNSAGTGQNVYVNGGSLTIGGDANIPDGLFMELYNGTKEKAKFYITSALNHTTEIEGLTTTPSEGRVVARGTDAHTVTAEDCAKLSYTYGDMSLVLDEENNQIVLGYPAETVQVTFDKVVTSYNTTYRIYGNGIPLIIKEGTSGSSYTVIYVDSDGDGAVTDADIWAPEGLNRTAAGNRYDTCYIFGGGKDAPLEADTSVTMLSGKVTSIFGGSYSSTVDGSTKVVIHGGTVGSLSNEYGSVYGAGQLASSRVTGDTQVIMDGGTVGNSVFGGGDEGIVGGNTSVTVTGGEVGGHIVGGSCGSSGGTSGGEIGGRTKVVFGGTAVAYDIMGGSYYCGTVGGDADLTITGGTIKENVYGSGYEGKVIGNVTISITGGTVCDGGSRPVKGVYGTSYRPGNSIAVGGNVSVSIKNASVLGCVQAKGCFDVAGSVSLTVGGTARIGTEAATATIFYNGIILNGGSVEEGIDSFVVEPDLTGDAKLYLYLPKGYVCTGDPVVATQGIQDDISYMELTGQTTVPDGMGLYLDGTDIYIGYPKLSVTDIAAVTTGAGAETKIYSYGDGADYATADEAVRAAWDYAEAQNGSVTVKLLDDVELAGLLTVENPDVDLTLDMEEGAVLSRTDDTNGQGPLITVSAGKLTVAGGTVESLTDGRDNAVKVSGDGILDITGGTLRSKGYVVYNDGGTVNVTGGLLELEYVANSNEGCLYTTGNGISNISGGTMKGVFTVAAASGTVNVSGDAEIIASIDWIGGSVYGIYLNSDGSGSDPAVNISGGTISTSARGYCVKNNSGSGAVTISGGTFNAGKEGTCVSISDSGTLSVTDGAFVTPLNSYGDGVRLSGTATADITGGTISTRRGVLVGDNAIVTLGGTAKVDGSLYGVYAASFGRAEIGGTAEISGDTAGVYVKERGTVDISGGMISGGDYGLSVDSGKATAILSGGTFTGDESSVYTSNSAGAVENFLAEGCAYYKGTAEARGPLISDEAILTGSMLAAADDYGTVTVAKFLLTITRQPAGRTVTYGYTNVPVLSVQAQSDGEITYQWYQVGENENLALEGETGERLLRPGLKAGDYQYYCAVSSGNYTVNSNTAKVKVNKKAVTVTADDRSKVYGDADPKLTYTVSGLVNEDTLTGIAAAREAGENAGE